MSKRGNTPETRLFWRYFGRRVAYYRATLGMSQAQFARHIGRAKGYVAHIEAGVRGVPVTDLPTLANALGRGIDELLPAGWFCPAVCQTEGKDGDG